MDYLGIEWLAGMHSGSISSRGIRVIEEADERTSRYFQLAIAGQWRAFYHPAQAASPTG
jgi:hypothetical protein